MLITQSSAYILRLLLLWKYTFSIVRTVRRNYSSFLGRSGFISKYFLRTTWLWLFQCVCPRSQDTNSLWKYREVRRASSPNPGGAGPYAGSKALATLALGMKLRNWIRNQIKNQTEKKLSFAFSLHCTLLVYNIN